MINKINALLKEVENLKAANAEELEALRIKYLSKKGEISLLRYLMRNASSSSAFAAFRFSTSLSRALILLIISNHFYFQRANLLLSLNTATDYGGFFSRLFFLPLPSDRQSGKELPETDQMARDVAAGNDDRHGENDQ